MGLNIHRDVESAVQRPVKAAVAASTAWLAVLPLGGVADQYPYYAPLGAVIAVSSTVAGSVRGSLQGLGAILLGAALALVALPLVPVEVLGLALVVAVGTWISGWHRLGQMAGWVPISAMFVLIIGRTDPTSYVTAYLGLTSLGAAIGVGLNLALPPLPVSGSRYAVRRTQHALTDQLRDLADGLRQPNPPTADEWRHHQHAVEPVAEHMRHTVAHMSEARRANWRASRWSRRLDEQYDLAQALERMTALVEELTRLLVAEESAGRQRVALGPELRPPTAEVLEAMANALESADGHGADLDQLRAADAAVHGLVGTIRRRRGEIEDDFFTAGTVVTTVRRAITSLVPAELSGEIPSPG